MTKVFRVSIACLLSVALGGVVLDTPAQAALPHEVLTCGSTVDHSLKLANNLTCTGDGLLIGANGVVLDLGGHRINGDKGTGDIGINTTSPDVDDYVVRNGTVADFGVGVQAFGDDVQLDNLLVTQNVGDGIVLGSSGGSIADSWVIGNGFLGIKVTSAPNAKIFRTHVTGNDDIGILVDGSRGSLFKRNTVVGNAGRGIQAGATDEPHSFVKNEVSSNGGDGLHVSGVDDVRFVKNTASNNRFSGIVIANSSDAVVKKNKLNGNSLDGLFVTNTSPSPTIVRNKVHENGLHGMDVQRSDATINKNRANNNGFLNGPAPDGDDNGLGILTLVGSSGSGNKASGNDDPLQCLPEDLC